MLVIRLVEEDIFPIARLAFGGEILERAILRDTMLTTQVLPEL